MAHNGYCNVSLEHKRERWGEQEERVRIFLEDRVCVLVEARP